MGYTVLHSKFDSPEPKWHMWVFLGSFLALFVGFIFFVWSVGDSYETKIVPCIIVETGTTPGSACSSSQPWTLYDCNSVRFHKTGIWGTRGDTIMVEVNNSEHPSLFK